VGQDNGWRPADEERDLSLPPHNLDAEEAVLGSILKHPPSIARVSDFLRAEDFYSPRNGKIYAAMLSLLAQPRPIDYHTVADELTQLGTFEAAGGLLYLTELNVVTPTSAHIEHYAQIVADHAARREMIAFAQDVTERAYAGKLDPQDVIAFGRARLDAIEQARGGQVSSLDSFPVPEDWGQAVASPLAEVEYVTDLVRPGRILLVAAVEGVGKSYVRDELAIRLAHAGGSFAGTWPINQRGRVLVLSEMHHDDDIRYRDDVLKALELTRECLVGRYWHHDLATAANGESPLLAPDWRTWVTRWCREHEVIVLFVDTVTTATGGMDSWGQGMVKLFADLRAMLAELPTLGLVLNVHLSKPKGGHQQRDITAVLGDWAKWVDVVVLLEDAGAGTTKLTTAKRVRRPRTILALRQRGLLVQPSFLGGEASSHPKVAPEAFLAAVRATPGIDRKALATLLGVGTDSVHRYAEQAPTQVVERKDTGTRYAKYRFYPLEQPSEG
jgi:hypothetical protein